MRLVGKIKEAHGLRGEVYVLIFSGDTSWLPRLKSFGVGDLPARGQQPGADAVKAEFTCQKAKPFKQGLILKANELGDRNAAESASGQGFYIPDDLLVSKAGEAIFLEEILGFTLKNVANETLGEIVGFSSNGPQDLLVIRTLNGKEAEVPFVEAFTKKLDFKKKILMVELPEGLLDLESVDGGDSQAE